MDRENKVSFTQEEIDNFAGLYGVLVRVHSRLINEGWRMIDGEMVPPDDYNPKKK